MRGRKVVAVIAALAIGVTVLSTGDVDAHRRRVTTIDFDNQNAPFGFFDTIALRRYGTTTFAGGTPTTGGGIITCASFPAITGFSGANCLAFNDGAAFSDGGDATDPETITFAKRNKWVSLLAGANGGDVGQVLTLEAFNTAGTLVDTSTLTLAGAMGQVKVRHSSGIKSVRISSPAGDFLVDDLRFKRK